MTELPEWVLIYFLRNSDTEFRCNICEVNLTADEKSMDLLEHIKENHKEVYKLHKDNPDSSVGVRIEFLHLDVMKNDFDEENQTPVIIGEVCDPVLEQFAKPIREEVVSDADTQLMVQKKKKSKSVSCKYNLNNLHTYMFNLFYS